MHLIYFFTYGYSLETWFQSGTIEKEVEIFKRLIKNENYKVTFVTFGDSNDLKYENVTGEINIFPIYKYIKYTNNYFIRYLKSFYVPYLINKKIKKPDIIKQNQLLGVWISIIYKYLTKKPLIVRTGYDMLFFGIKEKKGFIKVSLYSLLTKLSLKLCDLYTVTSKVDFDFIQEKFGKKEKIKIRPNWVYTEKFPTEQKRFQNKIICVGRLEKQKNYIPLIKSLENSNYELDIVGMGSLKEQITKQAVKSNVKVNFLGIVSNKKLLSMYENYKFFVLSSLYEGNPKVALEAMSKGCIPLLSDIPHHREIIDNEFNGYLFQPGNNELIEYLEKLNKNMELSNELSKNAYESVVRNNSIEKLVFENLNDFKNVYKFNPK